MLTLLLIKSVECDSFCFVFSSGEDENNNSHDLDDSPTAGKNKPTGMSKSGGNLAHRRIINANAANVANMERFKNAKLNAEKCIKVGKGGFLCMISHLITI